MNKKTSVIMASAIMAVMAIAALAVAMTNNAFATELRVGNKGTSSATAGSENSNSGAGTAEAVNEYNSNSGSHGEQKNTAAAAGIAQIAASEAKANIHQDINEGK